MSNIIDSIQLSGVTYTLSAQTSGGGVTTGEVQTMIDESISGKTNQSDFTGHTADTTIHVTTQDKTNWNAKSDFSGSYNDLTDKPTIPTVPTSNTAFTNDAGYATTSDVQTALASKADTATTYTKTEVDTALASKQTTLTAGTNITIVDNVISAEGGGKAVAAGTNISIITGETADTINCTLPITATSNAFNTISVGQGSGGGSYNTLIGANAKCDTNYGHNAFLVAQNSSNSSQAAYVNGTHNVIIGSIKNGYPNFSMPSFTTSQSVVIGGGGISTDKNTSVAIGYQANVSGTTKTNINNQLKIDTSNQVYIYNKDNTEMICLQDQLGGGSSYTAGDGIDITNDVISVTGKADTSAVTEVSDAFTAHTADTTVHTTAAEKTSWNSAATNASNAVTALGGLSLVKLTQSEYDSLATKGNSTLYVIVN